MTRRFAHRWWSVLAARPLLVDGLIAAGLFGMSVWALFTYTEPLSVTYRPGDLLGVVLVAGIAWPLAVRRRLPMVASLVVSMSAMLVGIWEYSAPLATVAVLVGLYSAGAYATFRRGLVALVVAVASSTFFLLWFYDRYPEFRETSFTGVVAVLFASVGLWALGRGVRNRRDYLRALEDRAHRLERTRSAEVRAAVAEERARIARELHDVVAHHVSVMTVQAAAARRTLSSDPERSGDAMAAVESTGRIALTEMRRLVGVLRGPDDDAPAPAELSPQPGLADLPSLVEQVSDAGLPVELILQGEQWELPPGIDVTIFRVVQEALTNTLKHAGVAAASVNVEITEDEVLLTVIDDGRGAAANLDNDRRPGHGLIGMRERVALYGGHLRAGPRTGGGFEVAVRLPLENGATTKVSR